MNIECVCGDCQILNVEDKVSKDGKIFWSEVVFMQGTNINTMTIDKNVAKEIKVGSKYDLVVNVTEHIKANNSVAYKSNKFKCVAYYDVVE